MFTPARPRGLSSAGAARSWPGVRSSASPCAARAATARCRRRASTRSTSPAHIYLALQELPAREVAAKQPAVVTVGRFQGGEAPNIIPGEAVLEGTIRTFDRELSAQLLRRIGEIAQATAAAFRGSAEVTELSSAPPLVNDPTLTNRAADLAADLFGARMVYRLNEGGMGSEDFASYGYELPCAYLLLGAGTAQENPLYGKPMHNEAVVFNEDVLPRGAALHTWCAVNFLKAE